MELSAFIESRVKALRCEPSERVPRPVARLAVERAARRSVASCAGIAAGDPLSLVDGSPAARLSPKLYDDRAQKRLLTFCSRTRRQLVELATTGIVYEGELDSVDWWDALAR